MNTIYNSKCFWKNKRTLASIVFRIKRRIFSFISIYEKEKMAASFGGLVIKYSVLQVIKSLIMAIFIWIADSALIKWVPEAAVNTSMFLDAVIGGIGVAGVILGLYCANISSIYTAKYSDAPAIISRAFQRDQLTQRCVGSLIKYIIYGIIVIAEILIGNAISWITVVVVLWWSITVIVSYSLAGNRAYQLSDVYAVADDAYREASITIDKRLRSNSWSKDINFQNHFLNTTEKQIGLLHAINEYGLKSLTNDDSPLYSFMCKNIALVSSYWGVKPSIGKDSLWYRNEGKYQKWHYIDSTEASIALSTGTALSVKENHDYLWLEDALFSMNYTDLKELIRRKDYESICKYLLLLDQVSKDAIQAKAIDYYIGKLDEICACLKQEIISNTDNDNKKSIAGVAETISLLYLGLFLKIGEYCKTYNIYETVNEVIHAIDEGNAIETSPLLRGRRFVDLYKRIITEIKVEGHRITPDWIIKQSVAHEEYLYINSLLRCIIDGMNTVFVMGKEFEEEKHLFEACIILTRFYEYESKYNTFKNIVDRTVDDLKSYHLDKENKWEEYKLNDLESVVVQWKKDIPSLLMKCSAEFTLDNWKQRDDYPDFLGECFNHICEDAVDAIVRNDISQFQCDYDSLSKMLLLYQEYIRTDFVKHRDTYRMEYAYYLVTSPIAEWAQIGGLAILWGEFHSNAEWQSVTKKTASQLFTGDANKGITLAEKMVEYAQNREKFILGVANRDILETGWNMHVANVIRDSGLCESEYWEYGTRLKTDSVLLRAFCSYFMDYGFISNPSEVFWVMCINPMLPDEKKYHTKGSWEEKLNDK